MCYRSFWLWKGVGRGKGGGCVLSIIRRCRCQLCRYLFELLEGRRWYRRLTLGSPIIHNEICVCVEAVRRLSYNRVGAFLSTLTGGSKTTEA